jgi:cytochrome c oxidase subunit III
VQAAAPDHPIDRSLDRPSALTVGTVVWLASELMFFSGLFAAYFTLRAAATGPWPPSGVDLNVPVSGLFTLVLVLSSGTMQLAVRAIEHGRVAVFRRWVLATLLLGGMFVANQAREWATLNFHVDSHAYGSAFYLMTGFHGLHVIGGLVAMLVLLLRASNPRFDAGEAPSVEVVSYYWHFVDVVWIGLWATLFLLR